MDDNHLIETRDIVVSIIFGAVLVVFINIRQIIDVLIINSDEGLKFIDNQVAVNSDKFFEAINNFTYISTAVTALLWGIVGIILYAVLCFVFIELKTIRDDINISTRYIHPKKFNQPGFWLSALWFLIYPLFVGLGFILWVLFSIKVLIPFSSVTFLLGLSHEGALSESIPHILVSFGTMCFLILGFIVFVKILSEFPKLVRVNSHKNH